MATPHPLRPLALAVSTRLNNPDDLLTELKGLPWPKDRGPLALEVMRAAIALAEAARCFSTQPDPRETVASPEFMRLAYEAVASLRAVIAIPDWQGVIDPERGLAEAAYSDFACGLEYLCGVRVIRPDVRNLLTNVTKALGSFRMDRPRPSRWSFDTLPRFE